jgi:hypothetical protein
VIVDPGVETRRLLDTLLPERERTIRAGQVFKTSAETWERILA